MASLRWQWRMLIGASLLFNPLVSLSGYAADTQPGRAGLAQALEQAWRLHPQATALESREAEARATQSVATSLVPEPGSVSIAGRNDRLGRNAGKQEYEIELATPLWLPGQRAARTLEAESRIDEVAARGAVLRLELAGELREAWWSLAMLRNARTLATRRLETARALEVDVRRRYRIGELSRIDANLAQGEVHVADAELIDAEAALYQAEQSLLTLTGAAPPQSLGEELLLAGRADSQREHPQLKLAAAAARSARAKRTVTDQSQRAAPELALRVVRERGDFAEPYVNSVGVRLKIPFSADAQIRRDGSAAQADAEQATAGLLRTQTRLQLELERSRRALQSSERQLVLAQERRELSAENLRLSEKAFSLGESDLATLLRIRATAFDAEAFLNRQNVARAAAISRLKQAMGELP